MDLYLKALEMQGFKSFPEKTRLTFDKPVTGIVGPNGSGKSNISDAVLWVMGEQSTRALRGGKMEDVIFGGTEKRHQVGFAEVSLILDNSDHMFQIEHTEVMITRRYYRSGESEYYINRQSVRLKDVNELLMDTGLGREGYSIISQGRIDEILSAKSVDRRDVFEEAAGISRFRHRKEDAERKLERTDENLVRVNDKISELSLQIDPLREQAETARKYLLMRDEMRGLEISVWLHSLDQLQLEADKLSSDHAEAKRQLEETNSTLELLYKSCEDLSEQMRAKDVEGDQTRAGISAAESNCAELSSSIAVLQTNLENNLSDIERIKQELTEQESRDGGIKAQIDERENRIREIEVRKTALETDTRELTESSGQLSQSAEEATRALAELVRNENEAVGLVSDTKANLSSLATSAQELDDRDGSVQSEIHAANERTAQLRTELSECNAKFNKAKEYADSLKNMINGYTMRLNSRRQKTDTANEKKMKLTMELNALKSRISLLNEMEKEHQGYSKAVKIIMQEYSRGVVKNIHGPIADLVKTDDRYTLAIETALGGSMQHIIVDTEEDGKAAINLLKRREGGRATFLPLSTIRGTELMEMSLKSEDGYEGVALHLVRFEEKYRDIYTNLLGRIVVVDTMDSAIRIARKFKNSFRIVTLDGQVINAGGSMTGGSSASNAGILSRANELNTLSGQETMLAGELSRAEREYSDAHREMTAAEYELEVSQNEMRALEDNLLKLESDKLHLEVIISEAEKGVQALREESNGIRERIRKNIGEIAATRKVIADSEAKVGVIRAKIEAKIAGQETLAHEREEIMAKLADVKAQEASIDAERDALQKAVSELSSLRDDLTGGRLQQIDKMENLKSRNTEIVGLITQREHSLTELNAKINAQKDRIVKIAAEKLELDGERTRRDKETQEKNRELLNLERECSRLEQKAVAAGLEQKQIIDKLWDTYELSRTTAMEIRQEITNLGETKRRIGELKREIAKLGNPNIGAIDEFERINTRYLFLTGQRDDIEKAKMELVRIIGSITAEMREIFAREFEVINTSFKETFQELFGGGKASLELEDAEDILNCGIEIKVQPPGKQLKTLTLLSGGEKAFVAIALYFAILKVRPTPFVIMDEIEAALDESNVRKFSGYMRKMSDKTQIIIITHRRGTMEETDVLYGVTMQEQGISRILSVDLEEAERTIANARAVRK